MLLADFAKGLIIGFAIAVPVGPVALLCIRRTLAHGRWAGFVSGLGAAVADSSCAFVAGFSLRFIASFLTENQTWFQLLGGLLLLGLGVNALRSPPKVESQTRDVAGMLLNFASSFAVTIANPMTILCFTAVFAGLGLADTHAPVGVAAVVVAGVFSGSACWWLVLSLLASKLESRITRNGLGYINRISGAAIALFGLWALTISSYALITNGV